MGQGANLRFSSKEAGSFSFIPRFQMNQNGSIEIGNLMTITELGQVGIGGGTIPTNAFEVIGIGGTKGGVVGFSEVVGYFKNDTENQHVAVSIDAATGKDPILYLSENGDPKWGIRNDASAADALQFRFEGVGARMFLTSTGNLDIDGTLTEGSDVNRKENIVPISNQDILEKLVQLPITEWQYKGTSERHIGPMAQDFHAAFALGRDETSIATVDKDGVSMAAIQAIYDRLLKVESENKALKEKVEKLEQKLFE